ncbi:hypothetical protein EMIHUDRAFT_228193 [Emiliania huxleyi CCMP1516]|uniref:Alcohol dehydrogenase N-terminal domain-containing protein n=2 Tax=Emiliania huxleyi TaxID=2903 RepID=A0A0D3KGK5_EMIH1|nr:hypothetical protein EMIHUDRAFT_228193 [Emiliania huxleyi CCMP1516]EOD34890.1 hypothetical protein EMIHUDRAFT_228193 [Emiliania huxleyi CCMP1516]|eukprot:XP_005787319.1 hypothetical protein EMIHUDRAFT_228193 [Emiliania huxleyi CCMP1516]
MPNLQPEKYFRESARKTFTRRKSAAEEESRLSRRSSGPRSPVTAGAVAGGEVDAVALQCDIDCVFETAAIKRRAVGPKDVQIDVKYCGVCHSDLTFAVGATKDLGIPQHWPVGSTYIPESYVHSFGPLYEGARELPTLENIFRVSSGGAHPVIPA